MFARSVGKIPEISEVNLMVFFDRVTAENTTHVLAVQQQGLRFALNEATTNEYLRRFIRKEVQKLQAPPAPELIERLRRNVRGFDQKPDELRKRIIQETRATNMGKKISHMLTQYFTLQIAEAKLDAMSIGEEFSMPALEWINRCLENHANRKFIGQLAIEWYGKRKR